MKTAQELYDEGVVLSDQFKDKQAIKLFENAIAIDSAFMNAYEKLISSYNNIEDYEKVILFCDKAIQVNPTFKAGLEGKGNALRAMGKIQDAHAHYDYAIKVRPEMGALWGGKASCFEDEDKYKEALECHLKNIELDPDNALPYANAGSCCKNLERYNDALGYYNKAIALERSSLLYIDRAKIYEALDKKQEEIEDYRAAQQALDDGTMDNKVDLETRKLLEKLIQAHLGEKRSSCCNLF